MEIIAKIKEPWNIMRLFRLGFGGYVLITSLLEQQYFLSFLGGLFVFQAVTNTGCFGGSCAPASVRNTESETDEIEFEDLTHKQKIES